ncbi:MAG: hypothetical protein MJB14_23475 [Spirochaetes bacterium]|nr:hypothetical protein [Spirochaetota bacterium]
MIKKCSLISFLLFFSLFQFQGIQFYPGKNNDNTSDRFVIEALFDIGFGLEGLVAESIGIRDYQTFFFKSTFRLNRFAFELDMKLRFRFFPDNLDFRVEDWYVEGSPKETAFAYADKIKFIKYGSPDHFIYATTGEFPLTTFGTGLLVNQFHNEFFLPSFRENGFYFQFNGNQLKKNLPVSARFLITDLLDPEIFMMDFEVDLLKFAKRERAGLTVGFSSALDLNATEEHLLSADTINDIESHRTNSYTTAITGLSVPLEFALINNLFQLFVFNEIAFLLNLTTANPADYTWGLADQVGAEVRLFNIKNSGYLFGVNFSAIFTYNNFFVNYFSSNYQIVRQLQMLGTTDQYNIYLQGGISLHAFQERLTFRLSMTTPLITNVFKAKFASSFIYDGRAIKDFIPGLYVEVMYETGLNQIRNQYNGNSSYSGVILIDSITDNFRFSAKLGYNIFGAKINFLIGIQSPYWLDLADYIDSRTGGLTETTSETYKDNLQKFIGVEVSFVF